jgi:hypothetical protein
MTRPTISRRYHMLKNSIKAVFGSADSAAANGVGLGSSSGRGHATIGRASSGRRLGLLGRVAALKVRCTPLFAVQACLRATLRFSS